VSEDQIKIRVQKPGVRSRKALLSEGWEESCRHDNGDKTFFKNNTTSRNIQKTREEKKRRDIIEKFCPSSEGQEALESEGPTANLALKKARRQLEDKMRKSERALLRCLTALS